MTLGYQYHLLAMVSVALAQNFLLLLPLHCLELAQNLTVCDDHKMQVSQVVLLKTYRIYNDLYSVTTSIRPPCNYTILAPNTIYMCLITSNKVTSLLRPRLTV